MKHDTISLRRRRLMIAGAGGAGAPAIARAVQGASARLDAVGEHAAAEIDFAGQRMVVSGRVLRPDGAPLAGATLEAWQRDAKAVRAGARTDADGRFMFALTGRPQDIVYCVHHDGHDTPVAQLRFTRSPGVHVDRLASLERDAAGVWRAAFGLTLA